MCLEFNPGFPPVWLVSFQLNWNYHQQSSCNLVLVTARFVRYLVLPPCCIQLWCLLVPSCYSFSHFDFCLSLVLIKSLSICFCRTAKFFPLKSFLESLLLSCCDRSHIFLSFNLLFFMLNKAHYSTSAEVWSHRLLFLLDYSLWK